MILGKHIRILHLVCAIYRPNLTDYWCIHVRNICCQSSLCLGLSDSRKETGIAVWVCLVWLPLKSVLTVSLIACILYHLQAESSASSTCSRPAMTCTDVSDQSTPPPELHQPIPVVISMDDIPPQQNDCVEVPAVCHLSNPHSTSGENTSCWVTYSYHGNKVLTSKS